jgi:transposase
VALEALRGDKTIQEFASKHKVHSNQVREWKRQALDGLGAVLANGADKAGSDHEAEVHDIHAKIG